MKFYFIFIIAVTLAGCSLYPISPVGLEGAANNSLRDPETMARRYPYWNVGLGAFVAVDADINPEITSPSAELLAQHRLLTVTDKRLMLQKMDLIRFVINTPEFEANFMKAVFWADRNASGPGGTLVYDTPLDNKRYLEIIRKRAYKVSIHKQQIQLSAAAVGVVGVPLYVLADTDRQISNSYWIALPNRELWSGGGYLNETYMSGVLFHEMLHNTGFNHAATQNDAVYGAQGVWTSTYNGTFQKKYAKELSAFRGYHETVYKEWLLSDTKSSGSRSRSAEIALPGGVICILHEDGTSTVVTNI